MVKEIITYWNFSMAVSDTASDSDYFIDTSNNNSRLHNCPMKIMYSLILYIKFQFVK